MKVEVVYALPNEQVVAQVDIEANATLRQAIERSGVLARYSEISLSRNRIGVFGKLRRSDEQVQPGDRIEIYRALPTDPKERRRQRAAKPRG